MKKEYFYFPNLKKTVKKTSSVLCAIIISIGLLYSIQGLINFIIAATSKR